LFIAGRLTLERNFFVNFYSFAANLLLRKMNLEP